MMCVRLPAAITHAKKAFPLVTQLPQLSTGSFAWKHTDAGQPCEDIAPPWKKEVQQRRCFCSNAAGVVSTQENKGPGILKKVLKKVRLAPNAKTQMKVASHILYESVADRINYLTFFQYFNMPNTFNSWFLVTELHVWMLLVRAMAEGAEANENGRYLRNCIVEVMWSDVNMRAKKLGADNPSRTRQQIETLSEQFQAALIAYDEGLASDDRVMAAALWRRFLEMRAEDYASIELLVKYVREQMTLLDELRREEFLGKPKVHWLDIEKERSAV